MLTRIRKYVKDLVDSRQGRSLPGDSGLIANGLTSRMYFDEETGEVIWDNKEHDAWIRASLGYKDCYISRMVLEQTGAFWDETVYSPRDTRNSKGLKTPLKSSARGPEGTLDPRRYGGVTNVRQAHWFIFAARNRKGQYKYFFEGVPIYLAHMLQGDNGDQYLQDYADEIAAANKCGKATILRKSVPLRQKLELEGTQYYLYGSSNGSNELRAAKAMWADAGVTTQLVSVLSGKPTDDATVNSVWGWLVSEAARVWPQVVSTLKLEEVQRFDALTTADKAKLIRDVLMKLNGTNPTANVVNLGGSAHAGLTFKKIASAIQSITWIDQSVTGIYERRTTFEELTRGL